MGSSDQNVLVPDGGEEPASERSSPVESTKIEQVNAGNGDGKIQSGEANSSSKVENPDLKMTPGRASRKGPFDDTHSPSSDPASGLESANVSPQQKTMNQTIVSHVPASVQQPALPPSEQGGSMAPLRNVPSDGSAQQPSEQKPVGAPIIKIARGTEGQVVTKKGRFRLLQDAPIIEDASETSNIGGDVASIGNGGAPAPVPAPEGGTPPLPTHPPRERTLSNASTLSVPSVPGSGPQAIGPAQQNVAPQPSAASSMASEPIVPVNAAPIVKKKGRFVVTPASANDATMIARGPGEVVRTRQITPTQPFPVQQGVVRQQAVQMPMHAMEETPGAFPQQASSIVQPMMAQEGGQQVYMTQGGEPQQYFVPVHVPQQQVLAGNLQHHPQQINPPVYYYATHPVAPQVVQLYPQHQQPLGPPPVGRSSHSPVPPSGQAPAHGPVPDSSQPPPPQQQEARPQHAVAPPQHPGDSDAAAEASQLPPASAEAPQQHPSAGTPLPSSSDAAKSAKAVKPKRPVVAQRAASFAAKGTPANVGFGKVFYFLDQMKLEVTEADRTIKNQQKDMKFLRERNKELEAKSREMEKRWLEEKSAREALEAKVKSLRKKVKELKGSMAANNVDNIKEVDDKLSEVAAELTKPQPQSRNNSLDGLEIASEEAAMPSPLGATHKMASKAGANAEQRGFPKPQAAVAESGSSTHVSSTSKAAQQQTQASSGAVSVSEHGSEPKTKSVQRKSVSDTCTGNVHSETSLPVRRGSSEEAVQSTNSPRVKSTKAAAPVAETHGDGAEEKAGNIRAIPPARVNVRSGSVSGSSIRSETLDSQSDNISPSRRGQASGMKTGREGGMGGLNKSLAKAASSQALGTIDDATSGLPDGSGLMNSVRAGGRTNGSLTSSASMNALQGDGGTAMLPAPVAPGHVSLPSSAAPTGSVVAFVTSPAVVQHIDFDPLRVSHDRNRDDGSMGSAQMGNSMQDLAAIPSHQTGSADASVSSMDVPLRGSVQCAPQHSQSQSMPNFVLQNGIIASMVGTQQPIMANSGQQMDPMTVIAPHHMQQQSWNQYPHAAVPVQQSQYIPMQYSAQPPPPPPSTVTMQPQVLSDPFDELALRRAPGSTGPGGLQPKHNQQQQQPQNNWSNQPT